MKRRFILLLVITCTGIFGWSQNLVQNPGFETYTTCPSGLGNPGPMLCTPWQNANLGSCDLYNVCAPAQVGVPDNVNGMQTPHTGDGYGGFYACIEGSSFHEYLLGPLMSSLTAGVTYYVAFYVSLADQTCGIENIGAYLSASPPPFTNSEDIDVTPQILHSTPFLSSDSTWVLIEGCFVAAGGEEWITIGTFEPWENTPIDPDCALFTNQSYYYIDDVIVQAGAPGNEIVFDLGDPVIACENYEIDPGLSNVNYQWNDGSTEPTFPVNASGTYYLTVTEGCDMGIDSIDILIISEGIDIGPEDLTICEGQSYIIALNSSWDITWQDGSHESTYVISTPGLYAVTVNNTCGNSTDDILVNIIGPPAPFSLGADTILCPGDMIEYDFDPSLGVFTWQDDTDLPFYSIDEGGTYGLMISNNCGMQYDEIVVLEYPEPIADLGADMVLCAGDTLVLFLSNGIGTYEWQDGSTGVNYSVIDSGEYSVTLTNLCGTDQDTVHIEITQLPQPDLNDTVSICPGQLPYTLDLAAIMDADSFLWNDGSSNAAYIVLQQGLFSVTVSNGCFTLEDSIYVDVEDAWPQVILPPDQSLCPGDSMLLTNSGSDGMYIWQDMTSNDSLWVNSSGTYSLTITTACGAASDSIMIASIPAVPIPDLGMDAGLCPGDQITLMPPVSGVSFLWQDMSTADTFVVMSGGTYFVEVTDQCSSASDTIVITLQDNPPVIELPDQLILCQGALLTLEAGIVGVSYAWNDLSINDSLVVFTPGTYSLTVTNSCGVDADTVLVLDGGLAPVIDLGPDQTLCPGDVITIDPGLLSADLVWQDGSSSTTFIVTDVGLIILTATNICGIDRDTIEILPGVIGPQVDLGPDVLACEGEAVTITSDISGVDFLWQDGSTLDSLTTLVSGIFVLEVSNHCGVDQDTIMVNISGDAPATDLGPDTTLCLGSVFILFSDADPDITNVLWQDGSAFFTYPVNTAGIYIIDESNRCGNHRDTILIDFMDPPSPFELGSDTMICDGDFILLNAPPTTNAIQWQDGSNASTMVADQAQVYSLEISNECGAEIDSIIVSVDELLPLIDLPLVSYLCPGEKLELDVTQQFPATYLWNNGSVMPLVLADLPGHYTVSVFTICNNAQGGTEVIVPDACISPNSFFIPNIFSPDGDGINDVFTVTVNNKVQLTSMEMQIFDRWGNLVFQSNTIPAEWRGDFNSKDVNTGVYVYRMIMQYDDGSQERTVISNGSVTLIR